MLLGGDIVKENFKSAVHMIIMDGDKILLQKRKGSKLWPGYYALPAGHIDEGENQYDALIREAREELNIGVSVEDIINSYVVLRRNYFSIDGELLDPYIDFYFEFSKYSGVLENAEEDQCSELLWASLDDLPYPFINYEGAFLEDRTITTYDCLEHSCYIKK